MYIPSTSTKFYDENFSLTLVNSECFKGNICTKGETQSNILNFSKSLEKGIKTA